jgi:monofunctional biosynthetic peptidoglycan transglycosylase
LAAVIALGVLIILVTYLLLPNPKTLTNENPEDTAYIEQMCAGDCPLQWMALDEISPFMVRAAVIAEDQAFYHHGGVSLPTLWRALQRNLKEGEFAWGGSTITMQLARNLYLYPDKSLWRKYLELILTYKLETALRKDRILEIYLNVVEWGPDIFGIEAASQHYFKRSASALGPKEAAFLASILPSPVKSREETRRTRFRGRGAIIFDRLVAEYLPRPKQAASTSEPCEDQLNDEAARQVDMIAAELISHFGVTISAGDGGLITQEELVDTLSDEHTAFLSALIDRFNNNRSALHCEQPTTENTSTLQALTQNNGTEDFRLWVPKTSIPALTELLTKAEGKDIPLLVAAAYRGAGYQIYLLIRELRLQHYCLASTRKLVESPQRSEHACLDTGAVDFGTPSGSRADFKDTEIYPWLLQHAPGLGFHPSYADETEGGVGFEPWHFRFKGEELKAK